VSDTYTCLATGDVHMSNTLPGARPTENGRTDRLDDQVRLWKHIATTAEENDVDDLFVVGDLFDKSRVDPVTLTTTVECLVSMRTPKWLLAGNHDAASIRGGRYAVEALGAMERPDLNFMHTARTYCPRPWLAFHPIAFMPVGDTRVALKEARKLRVDGAHNVLLFHNSILGASHLGWKCDDGLSPEEVCKGFSQVIAGHFHEHQVFGPKGQGMYVSAPMHHSYADVGRTAGYWMFKYKRGKLVESQYIDPGLPKFHVVHVKDGAIKKPKGIAPGDFVRWRVHATASEWVALRPQVSEFVDRMKAKGFVAEYKHVPKPSTDLRMATETEEAGLMPLEQLIPKYVEQVGLDESMSAERVISEGRNILAEARLKEAEK